MATLSYDVRRIAVPVAAMLLLSGCSGSEESPRATRTSSTAPTTSAPGEPSPTASPTEPDTTESAEPEPPEPYPVSLPAYFEREPDGGDLRLGTVREQTAAYTSYDASYRSGHLRVTGVLNVPTGKGPFPAVVLAHGYIDPAYYVSGQGMTRERGYLATQGFVAFHVDYRNHAGSDDDPLAARRLRTGYALDVVNAVQALRRSPQVPVDDDRIGLFGRSMGGGVVYKALEIAPGLVGAATAWASVELARGRELRPLHPRGRRPRPAGRLRRAGVRAAGAGRVREVLAGDQRPDRTSTGSPSRSSSSTAAATRRARRPGRGRRTVPCAGPASTRGLAWYPDEHAFGPSFFAAMARTTGFFRSELGRVSSATACWSPRCRHPGQRR